MPIAPELATVCGLRRVYIMAGGRVSSMKMKQAHIDVAISPTGNCNEAPARANVPKETVGGNHDGCGNNCSLHARLRKAHITTI
mmetsp:Transcript_2588/g.5907  ORF Transcript_2588/g.5907 Transcript_2588/m.5907 type:complete len:84 (+) Transcript_2588:677-928(+)